MFRKGFTSIFEMIRKWSSLLAQRMQKEKQQKLGGLSADNDVTSACASLLPPRCFRIVNSCVSLFQRFRIVFISSLFNTSKLVCKERERTAQLNNLC